MFLLFRHKYFLKLLIVAVVLNVIGLGLLSAIFFDFTRVKEPVYTESKKSTDEKLNLLPDTGLVTVKPNLKDFESLLSAIDTMSKNREHSPLVSQEQVRQDLMTSKEDMNSLLKDNIEIKTNKNTKTEFAADASLTSSKPKIAIVIDDLGMNFSRLKQLSSIQTPLNFAFLPYAQNLKEQTRYALKEGHELIVHLPMMPKSKNESLGPVVLNSEMSTKELLKALDEGLNSFQGYVGINNHMGSAFTEDKKGMRVVFQALKKRGLFFLDSKTTNESVGSEVAKENDLLFLERDVFLDHEATEEFVKKQLNLTERIAKNSGMAIAIGHPYPATINVLKEWLPSLKEKGFELVTLSSLLPKNKKITSAQEKP